MCFRNERSEISWTQSLQQGCAARGTQSKGNSCLKEVQMFLGAVGRYRKFIKDFSTIARPLTWLLEKDVTFTWGKEQDDTFNTLRHMLVKAPVLAHPDPTRPFVVTTDASKVGLGGELSQVDAQGQLHPVAYFSRALTKRERSYPSDGYAGHA